MPKLGTENYNITTQKQGFNPKTKHHKAEECWKTYIGIHQSLMSCY